MGGGFVDDRLNHFKTVRECWWRHVVTKTFIGTQELWSSLIRETIFVSKGV